MNVDTANEPMTTATVEVTADVNNNQEPATLEAATNDKKDEQPVSINQIPVNNLI